MHKGVRRSSVAKLALLFDGECGFCRGAAAVLRRLDLLGKIEFLDITREWDALQKRFPGLSREACYQEMHLVGRGGRIARGFDAYRVMAWHLPLGWLTLPFLYLPGMPAVGRAVYRWVAARRARGGCPLPGVR